ncbi:MAG: hypothetical protein AAGK37_01790 [Pseudomonadota bacterium]
MRDPQLWSDVESQPLRRRAPGSKERKAVPTSALEARLQASRNWTEDYARQAIEEYRRFLYLARVSDRQSTPSEVLDMVWHEHMVDTRDYLSFCHGAFGEILHHEPCKSTEEMPRYAAQYDATRALYRQEFATDPPADIWVNRTEDQRRADAQRAWMAKVFSVPAGLLAAWLVYLLFGFGFAMFIVGIAVTAIGHEILRPKVPGPKYGSGNSDGGSGCGGCGG